MKESIESIPTFTIIIPVTHSLENLEWCLASLDHLDYPKDRFHVVLVDCHVVAGLKEFVATMPRHEFRCSALSLPERFLRSPSWLHEIRVNEARNYAIQRFLGQCYVFTEDDCAFESDWLHKIEANLADDVGALGGPEILPEGMGWFPRALDCLLNSFLGTAGSRRGDGLKEDWYYPRKVNMAIPTHVLDRIGLFPEEVTSAADVEIAKRIRDVGFQIRFLPDNPVWHRRVTTFRNFVRRNAYTASEKVELLRQKQSFTRSLHFLILVATLMVAVIGLLSLVSNVARILLVALSGVYLLALVSTAVGSAIRTRSITVGLGVLVLMPIHQLSISFGVIKGVVSKLKIGT